MGTISPVGPANTLAQLWLPTPTTHWEASLSKESAWSRSVLRALSRLAMATVTSRDWTLAFLRTRDYKMCQLSSKVTIRLKNYRWQRQQTTRSTGKLHQELHSPIFSSKVPASRVSSSTSLGRKERRIKLSNLKLTFTPRWKQSDKKRSKDTWRPSKVATLTTCSAICRSSSKTTTSRQLRCPYANFTTTRSILCLIELCLLSKRSKCSKFITEIYSLAKEWSNSWPSNYLTTLLMASSSKMKFKMTVSDYKYMHIVLPF